MSAQHREVMHRKYRMLLQFLDDLRPYAALDRAGRRKEHYAIALYEQYAEWVSERLQAELRATARRAQADGDDYSDQ